MVCVVLEECMCEIEHFHYALVGEPVEDGAMLAARLDEAAPPKAGKVIRHLRLCKPESLDKLSDRQLTLITKQFEDPQPDRVSETAEILGDQIGLNRGLGETERRDDTHQVASISECLDMFARVTPEQNDLEQEHNDRGGRIPRPSGPRRDRRCRHRGSPATTRRSPLMPKPVEREELQRLVAAGAQLVEVLPPAEYEEEHLPGAINLPLKELSRETADRLDRERAAIVYCYDTT